MSLKTDLSSYLSAYAGLTSLVGTRIFPKRAGQTAKPPYCVFTIISRVREYSHQGYSNLERYRIQISTYAQDIDNGDAGSDQVDAIVEQLIAAMDAWPAANAKVQSCFHDGEATGDVDEYEPDTDAAEQIHEFVIQYG